jgi:hypothetical protein
LLTGRTIEHAMTPWPHNDFRMIPHCFTLVELGFPLPYRSAQHHAVAQEFARQYQERAMLQREAEGVRKATKNQSETATASHPDASIAPLQKETGQGEQSPRRKLRRT